MDGRRSKRGLGASVVVAVALACAACTETGGGPGPSTGTAAPNANGTGGFKSGIDPTTRFTAVAVSLMTTPGPVEMSDGKVHLAYELVLTNVATVSFRVDRMEMHDAATAALVPGTTGRSTSRSWAPVRQPRGPPTRARATSR
jgi:hypothetical protein